MLSRMLQRERNIRRARAAAEQYDLGFGWAMTQRYRYHRGPREIESLLPGSLPGLNPEYHSGAMAAISIMPEISIFAGGRLVPRLDDA